MNLENEKRTSLERKALETIEHYSMLKGVSAVLVGTSGGADSMSLLSFMLSISKTKNIKVYAAHVNHGLRGAEALRDENYVRQWCSQHEVELFVLHADVRKLAREHGRALEEEGRFVRYDFFKKKCNELGAVTATAHTLSDAIETQIMNYARGSGLNGLLGIPPTRIGIIRPLIRCTRKETEEYCSKYGIKYLDDSTNFSKDFRRNKIRLDMVPMLYSMNPSFDKAAARLFKSLEEDSDCLKKLARTRLDKAYVSSDTYKVDSFKTDCEKAVLNRCISMAIYDFTDKIPETKHIDSVIDILNKGYGKVEIVNGCFCEIKNNLLKFYYKVNNKIENASFSIPLAVGIYKINGYELSIVTISAETIKNSENVNKEYFKNAVNCDRINGKVIVRPKKSGDSFSPLRRNVTKSLKKLFNEEKVPIEKRSVLPILADDTDVLWVAGIGVSEKFKITSQTKNAVFLQIKNLEEN